MREWDGMMASYSYLGALDTHCDLEEARVVGAWDGLSERHEHRVDELGQHACGVGLGRLGEVRVRVRVGGLGLRSG